MKESEIEMLSMHGLPVRQRFLTTGQIVYECPYCSFKSRYHCHDLDIECRLNAYAEIHQHMKGHADRARSHAP
jgi:hypothetical protein